MPITYRVFLLWYLDEDSPKEILCEGDFDKCMTEVTEIFSRYPKDERIIQIVKLHETEKKNDDTQG